MNDNQKLSEITTILQGLAMVLKDQGKTEQEINQSIFELITQVEMAAVEEIIAGLPEVKQKQLEEMSVQNKPLKEIATVLQLDYDQVDEIEMRKFQDEVNSFLDKLPQKN
jgi:hypothetical protein